MVSVIDNIHAGIQPLGAKLGVALYSQPPLGRIGSKIVVGHSRLRLQGLKSGGGIGMVECKAERLTLA